MARLVLPFTIVLGAVTALTFAGAAVSLRPPDLPVAANDAETANATRRALVYAFYDAVNEALATGSLEALTAIVAPAILTDPADPADPQLAPSAFTRRLLALHAGSPALRLSVAALAVDGESAMVQVAVDGSAAATFVGLDLRDQPPAWSPVDVLRLAGDRVVAHNGTEAPPGWLESILVTPIHLLTQSPHRLTITRLTLAAGARHTAGSVDGARLLVAERGEVGVDVTDLVPGTVSNATLRAGRELALRADVTPPRLTSYQARNAGDGPAVLLDITLTPAGAPIGSPTRRTTPDGAGVTSEELIQGLDLVVPAGPAVLRLGRAILAPGDQFAWEGNAGTVLLGAGGGAQDEQPSGGIATVREDVGEQEAAIDLALEAEAVLLDRVGTGAEVRVLADRPATLLVATLLPLDLSVPGDGPPSAAVAGDCGQGSSDFTRADSARCTS